MFSVNRMPNEQRLNISNKVRDKRVPVAFGIAIAIVIIVSSLLFAATMLPVKKKEMGIMNKGGVMCDIAKNDAQCEIVHMTKFSYKGGMNYPTSCDTIMGSKAPTLLGLKDFLVQTYSYPDGTPFTYSYPSGTNYYSDNTPILDTSSATHVLVNSCHGCLCVKLQVTYFISCEGFRPSKRRSAQPMCGVYEGETVNVFVSKHGTDASSVDVVIVDPLEIADENDYQVIAPFTQAFKLNFNDLGDQVMNFSIATYDDNVTEGVETFEVQLSNPLNGTIEYPVITISIIDND